MIYLFLNQRRNLLSLKSKQKKIDMDSFLQLYIYLFNNYI